MAAVASASPLDRPKRGRGRPRKVPKEEDFAQPPPKRRRYDGGTPDRTSGQAMATRHTRTPAYGPSSPHDPDFAESAIKSDLPEDDLNSTPFQPHENPVSPRTIRARTESRPRRSYARTRSRHRQAPAPRPRYSSAAAAAAASQASDGYKPREERSWEEFHPDLDIEVELTLLAADEVDGRIKPNFPSLALRREPANAQDDVKDAAGLGIDTAEQRQTSQETTQDPNDTVHSVKRKPGRPPRRPESMLSGLGSPPAPRILPIPTHNPKERLNLPKPSYRHFQTFKAYEEDKKVQIEDYVDKAMANVGYQESELFEIPFNTLIRHTDAAYDDELGAGLTLESDGKPDIHAPHQLGDVEYDMDEQDERWLELHNAQRKTEQAEPIKPAIFEITMTQIEREHYALEKRIPKPNPRHANTSRPRSGSAAAVNGEPWGAGDEPDSKCAICDDGDCENANAIIFCDGCDLAVHQECYGVPFIPEGQWFCRKCKEIGRGTPTCIFCPNIEGAFKQTNTLRWSHLLCAIWIPEVTIANPTYMEPVQDIEKVPRSRWGLVCYICDQRMGACIQCSNKSCYQAFHVTCARRARLFLKMKATPTSVIDPSILKAFCDKHVSPDWRRDHDTEQAIRDAKKYYRRTMRNRKWADSQTAALAIATNEHMQIATEPVMEDGADDKNSLAANKRKKKDAVKTGWRLPSGAPVVPTVVFNAVEQSLARFTLRKRKDYVYEACKYWTLKREARRGAALLKRLQLQLESSSTMEITRRNFVAMGAAGLPKLIRRIDFAELLQKDVVNLSSLASNVTAREFKKLEDAENLKQLIDTVYFPITALLWPILRKAQKLVFEKSRFFDEGLAQMDRKLLMHGYTSIADFSADIGAIFADAVAANNKTSTEGQQPTDISQMHSQIVPLSWSERQGLSPEQKHQMQVAKRVVRSIKEPLEAALRKEMELKGVPFQKEMQQWAKLDERLETALTATSLSEVISVAHEKTTNGDGHERSRNDSNVSVSVAAGASPPLSSSALDVVTIDHNLNVAGEGYGPTQGPSPPTSADSRIALSVEDAAAHAVTEQSITTATKTEESMTHDEPLVHGGVPWYMRAFSPDGTTMYDERWQQRAISEDLSEVDEATLNDMDIDFEPPALTNGTAVSKVNPSPRKTTKPAAMTNGSRSSARRSTVLAASTPVVHGGRRTRSGSMAGSPLGTPTAVALAAPSTARTSRRSSTRNAAAVSTPAPLRKGSMQVGGGASIASHDSPDVLQFAPAQSNGHRRSTRGIAKESGHASEIDVGGDDGDRTDVDGELVDADGDEDAAAREKRERYNAKRRAQRRKGF